MTIPSTVEAQKGGIVKALDPHENVYRLEIDEFVQDTPMLNLFLLALEALQDNRHLKPGPNATKVEWEHYWWSFYCIAGKSWSPCIHGYPGEQAWLHEHNGQPGETGFYCHHSETTFPTWHRPYVLMMEQAVFNKMFAIADQFTDQATKAGYMEAVTRFRLPYWDPWMPRRHADTHKDWNGLFGVPEILRAEEVFVRRPKSPTDLIPIDNPLFRYKVPSNDGVRDIARIDWNSLKDMPTIKTQTTIRTPGGVKTVRNNDVILDYQLRSQVTAENTRLLQTMLNLPGTSQDWDTFANKDSKERPPRGEMSLESWHNNFHLLVGSGRSVAGNMSYTEVAAYDPIFWLHHCNIDRMLALYQALHPDQYVAEPALKRPLKPFYKGPGDTDFWTSEDAKDWKQCGFAVPGTKGVDPREVAAYINSNYHWMSTRTAPPADLGFPKSMDTVEALIGKGSTAWNHKMKIKAIDAQSSSLMSRTLAVSTENQIISDRHAVSDQEIISRDKTAFPKGALEGAKQRTWNIHLSVRKYAFDGSFEINAFLGDVDDDAADGYMLLDNQIGFSGIFASHQEAPCTNCKEKRTEDVLYGDVIPLTTFLVGCLKSNTWAKGPPESLKVLDSLEPEQVRPLLEKRLKWRITAADGIPKSKQEVRDSGLEIKVMDRWYHYPTVEEPLGWYEEPHLHASITRGKAGGYSGQ